MKKIGIVILFLLAAPLSAGVVYEIETTDHTGEEPKAASSELMAEKKSLRMTVVGAGASGNEEVIYRGDRKELTVVDRRRREYTVLDEKGISSLSGQIGEAMKELEAVMESVPEDQRELLAQVIREQDGMVLSEKRPAVKAVAMEDGGEKLGYPTRRFELRVGERKTHDLWVTPWDKIEGGAEAADAFEGLSGFIGELMDSLEAVARQAGPFEQLSASAFGAFRELGGFPVVTRQYGADGELEVETFLRSATERNIDPDVFEPPSGFRRQTL